MLLTRRVRALERHLPAALDGSRKGVHQARVASRRLREALPVLTSGLKGARAGKTTRKVRKLTAALGDVRELDVSLKLLDDLATRRVLPSEALDALRAHVTPLRDTHREELRSRIDRARADKLRRRLAGVITALDVVQSGARAGAQSAARSGADSGEWRNALGARLAKRSKRLASAIDEAGQLYAAEQLHQVRIAAKKLRYAMELAHDASIKGTAPLLVTLKRVQKTLGELHDLQVLLQQLGAVQAERAGQETDAALDAAALTIENACRHLHARYVAALPTFAVVVKAIRASIVPQLLSRKRATERPLKMTLRRTGAATAAEPR